MSRLRPEQPDDHDQHAHRPGAAARRAAGRPRCRSTLPGVEEQRAAPQRDGRPARGLRHPAADDARRAAARRRRRLDRRRQVDAGQLPRRPPGHRSPACCARRPARRCWCTTPTTPSGSARTGCCPTSSGSPHATNDPDALQLVASRHDARRAWRSSTPPTSTRSRSATARSPPSCSPRPTCGSSSPRPRATPTRCRGTSCARPPSARPRSRSCSTAPRTRRSRPSSTHLARMLASRGLKDSPLFIVHEGPVADDGLLPRRARRRHPRLARRRWPRTPRPAARWSGRPSTARSAR